MKIEKFFAKEKSYDKGYSFAAQGAAQRPHRAACAEEHLARSVYARRKSRRQHARRAASTQEFIKTEFTALLQARNTRKRA